MGMKQNYQKKLEEIISRLPTENEKRTLLLHACCAPCASSVLEYLTRFFKVTVYWYNPNIYPEQECVKRLSELKKLLNLMPCCANVPLLEGKYRPDDFEAKAENFREEPEGGMRCGSCIRMRLEDTARRAAGAYDYYCTTLSVSPHKDAERINAVGTELGREYGIAFLPSDFKKKEGYKRSAELCRQYGIYRQNYCGCRYVMRADV
jgi:predicted adenine nucleotide alpha hydrolase (AANH) superfamily ATPase